MECKYTTEQKEKIEQDLYYGGNKLKEKLSKVIGIDPNDLEEVGAGGKYDVYILYNVPSLDHIKGFIPKHFSMDEITDYGINIGGNITNDGHIIFRVFVFLEFLSEEKEHEEIELSQFVYNLKEME